MKASEYGYQYPWLAKWVIPCWLLVVALVAAATWLYDPHLSNTTSAGIIVGMIAGLWPLITVSFLPDQPRGGEFLRLFLADLVGLFMGLILGTGLSVFVHSSWIPAAIVVGGSLAILAHGLYFWARRKPRAPTTTLLA